MTSHHKHAEADAQLAYHKLTYHRFVRGVAMVAANALLILAILGWVFASAMG